MENSYINLDYAFSYYNYILENTLGLIDKNCLSKFVAKLLRKNNHRSEALNKIKRIERIFLKRNIELKILIKCILDYYNVTLSEINIRSRRRYIVRIRQISHFFCYIILGQSEKIGEYIGKLDHSTVLHSVKTIRNELQTDKKLRKEIGDINNMLQQKLNIKIPDYKLK